jgi:hypothetical protein
MQYSAAHPACAHLGEKLAGSLQPLLLRDSVVSFGVLKDGITVDDDTVATHPMVKARLAPHLHERGIIIVRFLPGVSLAELTQLIEILTLSPQNIFDRGGMGRLLLDRNVSRVQVEEIAHDITEEERESQKRRKELREFFATMLKNLLAQRAHGIDIAKQLLLLLEQPELAVTLLEDDPLGVCDAAAALCVMVRQEEEQTGAQLSPKLAPIFLALSPASQDRVLLGLPSLVGEFRAALSWALSLLLEEQLAEFAFPSFQRRARELDVVFYALSAAIPHDGNRRAALRRMALFFYDLPSDDPAANEVIEISARSIDDFDSYRSDRECLAPHARTALARRSALKWRTPSQPAPGPGPRLRASSVDARHVVAEVVKLSSRTRRFDRLCAHLPTAASSLAKAGSTDAVMGLVQALRSVTHPQWASLASRTLKELSSTSVVATLLEDLDRAASAEGSELDGLISTIQTLAIIHPDAVLDRLERSDSRKMRRILLDALPMAGAALLPLLRAKLQSPNWFMVRNVVTLLTKVGGGARDLLPVARHPNEKVRAEVARALRAVPLDEATVEIASAYLGDPLAEIRIQARGLVRGELASPTAVLVLERIADDDQQPDDARRQATEALGRCPLDPAASALFRLLQPRGLLELGAVRDLAAVALRASPAPDAKRLFQEALHSSARRVRKAAERAAGEGAGGSDPPEPTGGA